LEDGRNVVGGENASYFGLDEEARMKTKELAQVPLPNNPTLAIRGNADDEMVSVPL
jgi:hypothetical protein